MKPVLPVKKIRTRRRLLSPRKTNIKVPRHNFEGSDGWVLRRPRPNALADLRRRGYVPELENFLICAIGAFIQVKAKSRTREIIQLNKNSGVKSEEEEAVRRWPG